MKTTTITLKFRVSLVLLMVSFSLYNCDKEKTDPKVSIPDTNFLTAMIEEGVDTNGDGSISPEEAKKVTSLALGDKNITNMTGIETFINLEMLDCGFNNLTSLNLSSNTKLTELGCNNNKLTSLDISANNALTSLLCPENQLTSLDISNNTALTGVWCDGNKLNSLDLSNNTALIIVGCAENQLTSLDLSNNASLQYLGFNDNQLTSIDLSKNTALLELNGSKNNLASLDLSNNIKLEYVELHDMPALGKICVWEMPFPPLGVKFFTLNSPNVYFTTNCD